MGTGETVTRTPRTRTQHGSAAHTAQPFQQPLLGSVWFNGPPHVPKCLSQSGTTGSCLEVWKLCPHCHPPHPPPPKKSSSGRCFKRILRLNVTVLSVSSVCCVCGCQLRSRRKIFLGSGLSRPMYFFISNPSANLGAREGWSGDSGRSRF